MAALQINRKEGGEGGEEGSSSSSRVKGESVIRFDCLLCLASPPQAQIEPSSCKSKSAGSAVQWPVQVPASQSSNQVLISCLSSRYFTRTWSSDPRCSSRNSISNPTPLIKLMPSTRLLLMTTTNQASPVYQAAAPIRILAFHFAGSVIVSNLIWEASLP